LAFCRAERLSLGLQKKTIEEQQRKMKTAEEALGNIAESLQSVVTECLSVQNAVPGPQRFAAALMAVRQAKSEIKTNLNAKNSEGYVFGGADRRAVPFTFDVVGPFATYHGQDVHNLTPAVLANDVALAGATNVAEAQEVSLLGQTLSVAVCGPFVCGNGRFDFRNGNTANGAAGGFGANEISGDCYSVVSKIETLLVGLAANAVPAQHDLDDLARCATQVGEINRATVGPARARVWGLQGTFDGFENTIEDRSDQAQERADKLASRDMLEAQAELVGLSAQGRVIDSWQLELWRTMSQAVDYFDAVGRL
jgi:hypothetical protein